MKKLLKKLKLWHEPATIFATIGNPHSSSSSRPFYQSNIQTQNVDTLELYSWHAPNYNHEYSSNGLNPGSRYKVSTKEFEGANKLTLIQSTPLGGYKNLALGSAQALHFCRLSLTSLLGYVPKAIYFKEVADA